MENIIIVECMSTGINFIQDIVDRNYHPIILDSKPVDNEIGRLYAHHKQEDLNLITEEYTLITEKDSYEETLEMVRKFNPVLILPGSEKGVVLATRLSNDLNLLGNSYDNIEAMTLKNQMQERIREHGLRSIKGQVVHSLEEAIEFYDRENLKGVVIKPIYSAASSSVKICLNKEDMINNIKALFEDYNCFGNENTELLIQEYIDGEEYVIDTVSCEGRHAALFGMKYIKRFCKGYGMIYDTDIYFSPDDETVQELVAYCFRVIDCLGIIYGPVHGEFMMDAQGPVLIEVNCRPAGAFQKYTFQDKVMQNHETAVSLDSYLMDTEQFGAAYPERMHLKQPAIVKQLCLEEPIFVKRAKLTERLSKLESFD